MGNGRNVVRNDNDEIRSFSMIPSRNKDHIGLNVAFHGMNFNICKYVLNVMKTLLRAQVLGIRKA